MLLKYNALVLSPLRYHATGVTDKPVDRSMGAAVIRAMSGAERTELNKETSSIIPS